MVMQATREYCKCGGAAGYLMVDGELVCQSCGGISPRARLNGEQFVKLGDHTIKCPKCGTLIQEARPELKIGAEPENKIAKWPDTKRIVPRGVGKIGKRR